MTRYGVLYPDGKFSGNVTDSASRAASYAKLQHGKVYEVGSAEDPARRGQPRLVPWYPDETEDFHAVDVNDRHQDRSGSRTAEDDRLDDPRHGQAQLINASVFGRR